MNYKELEKANYDLLIALRRYSNLVGEDCEKIEYSDDPNERQLCTLANRFKDKLDDIAWDLKHLDKEIWKEGNLRVNSGGRYEVKDTELTSGYPIEWYDPENNEWVITRIEHNGTDYYIVAKGRDKAIYGERVRLRY